MGDDQDGPAGPHEGPHGLQDVGLAGGVEVGRGLVQDHQGGGGGQRPGQGQALALAHRQADPALADPGEPAVGQGGQDLRQPGGAGRRDDLGRRLTPGASGRLGPHDVVQDGAGGQDGALGHPGDLLPPGRGLDTRQVGEVAVGPAYQDAPAVGAQEPQHHLAGGGLAGPRGPGQGRQPPGPDGGAQRCRGPGAAGGHGDAVELNGGGGQVWAGARPGLGQGDLQDLEDGLGGGGAARGGVELEADLPQGLVDLGRHHEHQEAGGQVQVAVHEAEADLHGHDGHAQGGEELQDGPGQEGYAQGGHGGAVVGAPQLLHPRGRPLLAAQRLEGG